MTIKAIETLVASATAVGATEGAFTALSGLSLTVREGKSPVLLAVHQIRQSQGFIRVKSPLMHDGVVGLKLSKYSSKHITWSGRQPLNPQDELSVTGTGSATAGDVEFVMLQLGYAQLPGVAGEFISPMQALRAKEYAMVDFEIASSAAGFSGEVALGALTEYLKANSRYALLGMCCEEQSNAVPVAVRVRAPDWGNLGIAMHQGSSTEYMHRYFAELSDQCGESLIPVFHSNNRDQILVDVLANENLGTLTGQLVLGRL